VDAGFVGLENEPANEIHRPLRIRWPHICILLSTRSTRTKGHALMGTDQDPNTSAGDQGNVSSTTAAPVFVPDDRLEHLTSAGPVEGPTQDEDGWFEPDECEGQPG
jgi:hypothetical protein